MRLLNTKTLDFGDFFDTSNRPAYAILSHRWGPDEATYKAWRKREEATSVSQSAGYLKIAAFCDFARRRGFDWAWIDTCCIDKRSSAELSEAINSMFQWYASASLSVVWLHDVPGFESDKDGWDTVSEAFQKSEWFTRGWTLQELLAPKKVLFCNSSWEPIGHKCVGNQHTRTRMTENKWCQASCYRNADWRSHRVLNAEIAAVTSIQPRYLLNHVFFSASVATRMSWASRRKTTRVEDMAYCLMGLFGINMPLLYGEGNEAFVRFQEQLIESSDDESLFAWNPDFESRGGHAGMLARSPVLFKDCGDVLRLPAVATRPYSITNRGLQFFSVAKMRSMPNKVYIISLRCTRSGSSDCIKIALRPLGDSISQARQFTRVHDPNMALLDRADMIFVAESLFYISL